MHNWNETLLNLYILVILYRIIALAPYDQKNRFFLCSPIGEIIAVLSVID